MTCEASCVVHSCAVRVHRITLERYRYRQPIHIQNLLVCTHSSLYACLYIHVFVYGQQYMYCTLLVLHVLVCMSCMNVCMYVCMYVMYVCIMYYYCTTCTVLHVYPCTLYTLYYLCAHTLHSRCDTGLGAQTCCIIYDMEVCTRVCTQSDPHTPPLRLPPPPTSVCQLPTINAHAQCPHPRPAPFPIDPSYPATIATRLWHF